MSINTNSSQAPFTGVSAIASGYNSPSAASPQGPSVQSQTNDTASAIFLNTHPSAAAKPTEANSKATAASSAASANSKDELSKKEKIEALVKMLAQVETPAAFACSDKMESKLVADIIFAAFKKINLRAVQAALNDELNIASSSDPNYCELTNPEFGGTENEAILLTEFALFSGNRIPIYSSLIPENVMSDFKNFAIKKHLIQHEMHTIRECITALESFPDFFKFSSQLQKKMVEERDFFREVLFVVDECLTNQELEELKKGIKENAFSQAHLPIWGIIKSVLSKESIAAKTFRFALDHRIQTGNLGFTRASVAGWLVFDLDSKQFVQMSGYEPRTTPCLQNIWTKCVVL